MAQQKQSRHRGRKNQPVAADRLPEFLVPDSLNIQSLKAKLFTHGSWRESAVAELERSYYDSFDWRLFRTGTVLLMEWDDDKTATLVWRSIQSGTDVARMPMLRTPRFATDVPTGATRDRLRALLEMRALLPLATFHTSRYAMRLLNADSKTVLRIFVDYNRVISPSSPAHALNRLHVMPVKGYPKAMSRVTASLASDVALPLSEGDLLHAVLAGAERQPGDYSGKLDLVLDPAMRADAALQTILRRLLTTMEANEAGTKADTDSEFLHEFRVAVRRTRSALGQIKQVLPEPLLRRYRTEFAWLGQITGPTRDLDVYLLKFPDYRDRLPPDASENLSPLLLFLNNRQREEQQRLAQQLESTRYTTLIENWRKLLASPWPPQQEAPANASRPIIDVASRAIRRAHRRLLRQGRAIPPDAPVESLHELRKTGKKLRYLLEFFQSLYAEETSKRLLKDLKKFQENLGDINDLDVQIHALRGFGEQMNAARLSGSETLLAMGMLIAGLEQQQAQARAEFTERFTEFDSSANRVTKGVKSSFI